jgi:hypothetical protein
MVGAPNISHILVLLALIALIVLVILALVATWRSAIVDDPVSCAEEKSLRV